MKLKLRGMSRDTLDALERERYEILRELTSMMFQDGIGAGGVIALGQAADMIRKRSTVSK